LNKLMDPRQDVYGKLERLAQRLEAGQRELFSRHGIPSVISRVGSASCVYFTSHGEPRDWWDILEHHDAAFDARYRRALIERGIYHFPVIVKQGSISFAHTEADIDQTLEATDEALRGLHS
jgi:glutamate-1-semialdehyde 2,1-aminomutase